MTAVARLLEAPKAPQGLGQDQLVGRPADSGDRVPLTQRLLPELDRALPAAGSVLMLSLGLAAPGAEQRSPARSCVPGLGLGVAAEPGVDRGVAVSVRSSHAGIGSVPNVPSDTAVFFVGCLVAPTGRTAPREEEKDLNFRQRNDAELADLVKRDEDRLLAYIVEARRAGQIEAAVKGAQILAFSYEKQIRAFVHNRLGSKGKLVTEDLAELVLADAIASVGRFEGSSIGEFRALLFTHRPPADRRLPTEGTSE